MNKSTVKTVLRAVICAGLVVLFLISSPALAGDMALRDSVVKIYSTLQRPDYSMPWQQRSPSSGSGSGLIIEKRRILTNAHVVSDTKFLQVQKNGDARHYPAKVSFIAHDCDLAVLTVEDDAFFDDTKPMKFANKLPELNTEVTVLGYPTGGTRLSVTKGVVSRIDYSVYSHSDVDQHLVIQVDAAINPGNSGGPIIFNGKVVAVAFQELMFSENIGYGIPVPVIRHFLEDIADNKYDGYPELGVSWIETINPALHRDLTLSPRKTGIAINYIDPFGSAVGHLKTRDVLLSVDGHTIESDGTVLLNENNVPFAELLERKQCGQSVVFQVWRNNAEIEVKVPLKTPDDLFVYRNIYDALPNYYVYAGLVFSPLSREYLDTLGKPSSSDTSIHRLIYYSEYAKIDGLNRDRDEFVVLIRQLPHPVNTYTHAFQNGIVTNVNGVSIRKLSDIKAALEKPLKGFHVIRFSETDDCLILDAGAAKKANDEILIRYGVPSPEHFEAVK